MDRAVTSRGLKSSDLLDDGEWNVVPFWMDSPTKESIRASVVEGLPGRRRGWEEVLDGILERAVDTAR